MVYNVYAFTNNKETVLMKFKKLTLDESLFDDDFEADVAQSSGSIATEGDFSSYIDDDFSDPDYTPDGLIPKGPEAGESTGIADTLIALINDEWEAIRGYNNFVDMIKGIMDNIPVENVDKMLPVIADIVNEENKHVGQLQELLKLISPNASSIEQGSQEGASQIADSGHEWVNGKLKVEMMPEQRPQTEVPTNQVDNTCTLYDVDDDF